MGSWEGRSAGSSCRAGAIVTTFLLGTIEAMHSCSNVLSLARIRVISGCPLSVLRVIIIQSSVGLGGLM